MLNSLLTTFTLLQLSWNSLGAFIPFLSDDNTSPSQFPLSNSFASKNGNIQLTKDYFGFYVNVDLTNKATEDPQQHFGTNTVSMILALYTSQTLLVENCLHFSPYNCSQYSCTGYLNESTTIHSPYFTGEGYLAKADMYLDYANWNLNTNASIASSCSANTVLPYGLTRYGVLGLGTANNSRQNFINSPMFSISLAPDLLSGQLLFGQNDAINSSRDLVAVLPADEDWKVNANSLEIVVGNKSVRLSANLIFDINAEALGLPIELYNRVLDFFATEVPMNCITHAYQPVCFYNGDVSALPNITISIQDQIIVIEPETYVQNATFKGNSSIITLNIKAISPNLTDYSYITSKYNNYIILDSHVMSNYTVLFDATSSPPTIKLYGSVIDYRGDLFWVEVVVLAVIFLAVVFCCCFCTWTVEPPPKVKDIRTDDTGFSIKSPLIQEDKEDDNIRLDAIEESPPTRLIRLQRITSDTQFNLEEGIDDFKSGEPRRQNTKPSELNL